MQLVVDTSWNNQKNKAKVIITFENLPKSLFQIEKDDLVFLKTLEESFIFEGPNGLKKFEDICLKNPKSLYAKVAYFQAFRSFEFFEEALSLYQTIKEQFPNAILTKCIKGHYLVKDDKEEEFLKLFSNQEVLKAAFNKRKLFHYKEALFFHNAWLFYYGRNKNQIQAEKHAKFITLILHTLKTFSTQVISPSA